jgi:acetyl-CoA carboxylase carboxyltransferase component
MPKLKSKKKPPVPAADLRALTERFAAEEDDLRLGGGESGRQRQIKLGRLPVRERLDLLLDKESPRIELGLWAAYGMYGEVGGAVAAGVVTVVGRVHGRDVMVVANDATVKAGAFFPATAKKVLRAQKVAARCNLPLIYLVDSAGVFLPMQDEIFPDEDDFGRIFRNNAVLSAMGVPQYAAVMGNCVAGGAYLPVLSDKLLMTRGSEMDLAGPSLVKAAIGQAVDSEELGGAKMHAQISGTVDFYEETDQSCLARLRTLTNLLSAPDRGTAKASSDTQRAASDPETVYELVSSDGRKEYDARDLLACVIDAGSFNEYKSEYGKTLVCGYANVAGRAVGIVANQKIRTKSPRGELQIGGVIYHESADKAARFVMDCNQTQIPIVFFQDVTGFMVGRDSEQAGIIRSGAKLVNAVSNSTVPKITFIVGGSFGAGNYALCGKAFDPALIFAWPCAKYAVMGADQAAGTLLQLAQRQAERAGKKLSQEELDALRATTRSEYLDQTDIRYGAARGWVDAIIAPHSTRQVLISALEIATRPPPTGGFRGGVMQV